MKGKIQSERIIYPWLLAPTGSACVVHAHGADVQFQHSSSLGKEELNCQFHPHFLRPLSFVMPLPCLKLFMKPSRGGNLSGSCTTRWGILSIVRTAGIRRQATWPRENILEESQYMNTAQVRIKRRSSEAAFLVAGLYGRTWSHFLSYYLPRGNGWLWARLPGASL